MTQHRLNGTLQCPECGTVRLDLPDQPDSNTVIPCSTCHKPMGTWGELRHDFVRQAGKGVFALVRPVH
ncbi:hypothetical protein C7I87_20835 [Mesorhizobium sp. SARCC-RB16n]|nr:hypothetical protein C7I87_20835 [Mesorhizobium sp. SARCC-RB16n]